MKSIKYNILYYLLVVTILAGCKKYLSEKSDKSFTIPTSVADLQSLLDNAFYMNNNCAETGEIAADSYYLTDSIFSSLPYDDGKKLYLWQQSASRSDWQNEYNVVYYANLVLDNIASINRNTLNSSDWDFCKGSALVYRAKSFFEIAQIWSKAYDSTTAKSDLGIPLRVNSDYTVPSTRPTVEQTYTQIIQDLKNAIPLLPITQSHVYRPTKQAAYGLLARTYLSMRKYELAKSYADSCLMIKSDLLDFNTLDTTQSFVFYNMEFNNPEDIMHSNCQIIYLDLVYVFAKIDTTLYSLYDRNDLRKVIYFADDGAGGHTFQGSYDGYYNYNGVATDEMFLIRSECETRLNQEQAALNDLNYLLSHRYKTGTFTPYASTNLQVLLNIILTERRKELFFRMLRFGDIKRLNLEGANITLTRKIGGATYTLQSGDPKWALPIPTEVIQLSHIAQN